MSTLSEDLDPHALADSVTVEAVMHHLRALQGIADRNDNRRASGTPGYEESVDYVVERLVAAGFDVEVPEFPIIYEETVAERLVVGGDEVDITVMRHSPDTPVGGVTAPLAVLPEGATGCAESDFAGADYTGTIVLIARGGGPHYVKQANAAAAGAVGTVIYNTNDEWLLGNLVSPDNARIPTGGISKADGAALRSRAGERVTLELRRFSEPRVSRNVIAQTRTGRTDRVVMAGAHLDSVVDGPGINDAGAGCAALLTTALSLGGSPDVRNAVRFAWWGAEELGQIGSNHYVRSLTEAQLADVALYLNFDMLSSPNGGYFVFDGGPGPEGSAHIEQSFRDFLACRGVATEPLSLFGGFDHAVFVEAGVPTGGLYTGATAIKTAEQAVKWGGTAGLAYDPNYHQAADQLSNVDQVMLANNAAAVGWVIARYAADTDALPTRAS
ncbi:M28 family peptidase [Actinokineospora sp. HUAS TT18]|uniref:M28 family peptidase n=1 Tax=Actinokineospora sp. HUAS TT18 TaxID=3447451 RepID=UPI003F51C550